MPGDSSHRQVDFSSPAYRLDGDQYQMFSGRNTSTQHQTMQWHNFVERLYTRAKVGEISTELKSIEAMFL